MSLLRHPVRRPTGVDFLLAPPGGPTDLAVAYPVVRFAGEAPVPDGRVQGDGLAVKNKFPVGGTKRRHDLVAAPAAALVGHGGKGMET